MNRREEQELNDWLEGRSNKVPTDEELLQEWQIQSIIDTLLQIQEGELSLSDDFHEKLRARIETLKNEKPDEEAPLTKKKRKTVFRPNQRVPLDWRPIVCAIAAILLILVTVGVMRQPNEHGLFERLQAVFSPGNAFNQGRPIATVDYLEGQAKHGNQDDAADLFLGAVVREEVQLHVPPGHNGLRLRVYGGTILDVRSGTTLRLRRNNDVLKVEISEGSLSADASSGRQQLVLTSAVAKASTSDALTSFSVQPGSTRVTVDEGNASVRNLITREVVTVVSGETVVADKTPEMADNKMDKASIDFPVTARYLLLPIGGPDNFLRLSIAGQTVHALDVNLATSERAIQWWSYLDLDGYQENSATVTINGGRDRASTMAMLNLLRQEDERPTPFPIYGEASRPQLQFSQLRGRASRPSGLTYYRGEYHLFWSATLGSLDTGPRSYWGHAVSSDLIRWRELPPALRPGGGNDPQKRLPDAAIGSCWPGSAHVDIDNLAGWSRFDDEGGQHPAMVAAYTDPSIGGVAIAYSTDRGRSWEHHAANPVIRHSGRDPKLIWHAAEQRWLMLVADDNEAPDYKTPGLAFYASKNLRDWTQTSRLPGIFRSPDLLQLGVSNGDNARRWVLFSQDGSYRIGSFYGDTFVPETDEPRRLHWGSIRASQTFSNLPDGRVIQLSGTASEPPGMPFRNGFSLPMRLSLRNTTDGLRLFASPIREIERLRLPNPVTLDPQVLRADVDKPVRIDALAEFYDLQISIRNQDARRLTIDFAGGTVQCDFRTRELKFGSRTIYEEDFETMPLPDQNGRVNLRLIVDRASYHLVGGNGRCLATAARNLQSANDRSSKIRLSVDHGKLNIETFEAHAMRSIWR